jgi:hypothetical protein
MRFLLLPILILTFAGCISHQDVSENPKYAGNYVVGATYQTQQTLAIRRLEVLVLCPGGRASDPPGTILKGPNFVGAVPRGTLLRVSRLDLEKHPHGNTVWPYGECVDGQFANMPLNLFMVSEGVFRADISAKVPMVDTNFLQIVRER